MVCLDEYAQKRPLDREQGDSRDNLPCPSCKKFFALSPKDLQTNFVLRNLVNHLKLSDANTGASSAAQGSDSDEEPARKITCSQCESATAIMICRECRDWLCPACTDNHRRTSKTKAHSLEEIGRHAPLEHFIDMRKSPYCDISGHEDKKIDMYCKRCDKVLCLSCAVTEHNGDAHDIVMASKIVGEYKEKLRRLTEVTREVQQKSRQGIAVIDQTLASLEETEQVRAREVLEEYGRLKEELDRQRDRLLRKVKQISERKKARLNEQREELTRVEDTLQKGIQLADDIRENCIPVEIMYFQSQMEARLQELCREYGDYPYKPKANDIIGFVKSNGLERIKESNTIGSVSAEPDPSSFTVDGIENAHFIEGKQSKLMVTCRDIIGNKLNEHQDEVSATLQRVGQENPIIPCEVKNNCNGTYTVAIQPQTRGPHRLTVSVNVSGESSERPPYNIMVSPPQRKITEATKVIRDDNMQNPLGITVTRNELIVVSDITAHCLFVFDKVGNCLRPIGKQGNRELEFEAPRGIACTPADNIIVAEKGNHRLQEVTLDGGFVRFFGANEVGKCGSEVGNFHCPLGVAVNSEGFVFATDSMNQRIQCFKSDGTFVAVFGKWGSGLNSLNVPYGISIYSQPRVLGEGNRELLFVSEREGNRVQCFEMQDGAYKSVAMFGSKGQDRGHLNEPVGVLVDSNTGYLLVTELKSHQVSVFTRSGEFVYSFGDRQAHAQFRTPMSVATLGDSHIIVTDCKSGCLKIFRSLDI